MKIPQHVPSVLLHTVLILSISLLSLDSFAFAPQQLAHQHHAVPGIDRNKSSPTRLYNMSPAARKRSAGGTSIAGRLWPAIQKFQLTKAKGKDIVNNVMEVTQWQDLVLLGALAFASMPIAYWSYQRKVDRDEEQTDMDEIDEILQEKPELLPFAALKRFGIAKLISQISKVALSVYAVDVLSVTLTALGFRFPEAWGVSALYAKLAYTIFFLKQFLAAKEIFLCRWFKVDSDTWDALRFLIEL